MKQLTQISSVILFTLFVVSCSNGQNKTKDGSIAENVNVEQFAAHLDNAQILDVRTPGEWSEGIIEGAIMYDFYEGDFDSNLEKLDKEKPVAVYCKSGGRSGNAMEKMAAMGFKEVYNLKGGIGAWRSADKPTVKP
jgi:rhodanese-related sulfurtransferase